MICGPNASVGLNMQWANRVVHWDMEYKSIEMVSQKTWRLDRRWDSSRNDVMKEFKVTYLVLEKDKNKAKEIVTTYNSSEKSIDICLKIKKCDIDSISNYLIKLSNEKDFPNIALKE